MSKPTPVAERRRLVACWRSAHPRPSMTAFARSIGVAQSTFWRWTRDFADDTPADGGILAEPAAAFVELATLELASPGGEGLSLRLEGSAGISAILDFDVPPPASWLGEVLNQALSC